MLTIKIWAYAHPNRMFFGVPYILPDFFPKIDREYHILPFENQTTVMSTHLLPPTPTPASCSSDVTSS